MINKITVTNHLGESIDLELRSPEKSGFLIYNITGLNPPKATINTTDAMSSDGSVYNSARTSNRNIVFHMIFKESPTIEDTRQKLYRYFPLKKPLLMTFITDRRASQIAGYVESVEVDMFTMQEGAVVSVICPDPYFYSSDDQRTLFSGAEPFLEFPYSNEAIATPVSEFGYLSIKTANAVVYTGDGTIGVVIYIHAIGSVTNLKIYNLRTREVMSIIDSRLVGLTGHGIQAGDDIIISTIKGEKSITLVREGVITNILNCLERGSDWFQLENGDNVFAYTTETGVTNLQFMISNKVAYEGV